MSSETDSPAEASPVTSPQWVRAWLAEHVIIEYVAADDSAVQWYLSVLRGSLGTLRVTVEPLAGP